MWALLKKNEGTAGRESIYLAAPEDRAGVKGYLGPVVVFMGICIKLIEHLDGLQTLLVSNLEEKNGFWCKNMERYKKAEYLWDFSLNYNTRNSRVMCGMSDSFSPFLEIFYDLRYAYL